MIHSDKLSPAQTKIVTHTTHVVTSAFHAWSLCIPPSRVFSAICEALRQVYPTLMFNLNFIFAAGRIILVEEYGERNLRLTAVYQRSPRTGADISAYLTEIGLIVSRLLVDAQDHHDTVIFDTTNSETREHRHFFRSLCYRPCRGQTQRQRYAGPEAFQKPAQTQSKQWRHGP